MLWVVGGLPQGGPHDFLDFHEDSGGTIAATNLATGGVPPSNFTTPGRQDESIMESVEAEPPLNQRVESLDTKITKNETEVNTTAEESPQNQRVESLDVKVTKNNTKVSTRAESGPTGATIPTTTTIPRTRRSPKSNVAYMEDLAKSIFPAGEETLEKRIHKGIQDLNEVQPNPQTLTSYPKGVAEDLQTLWSQRQWDELIEEVSADETSVSQPADNRPSWVAVRKIKTYDQYVTIQIKTPISPAIDAVNDAAYHLQSDRRMREETYSAGDDPVRTTDDTKTRSLKSPRGHPKFGKGTTKARERRVRYPLVDHASTDHVIDVSARRSKKCKERTEMAVSLLGPVVPAQAVNRQERQALASSVALGAATVAGLFGLGWFGLGGQVAQLKTETSGLRANIHSLRRKTSALLQAEGVMKDYIHQAWTTASQKHGAVRRGLLAHATVGAACDTADGIKRAMEEISHNRLPIEMFESKGELRATWNEIKTDFLQPLGLHFIIEDELFLLRHFCEGYLQSNRRKVNLVAGQAENFNQGSLGYAWVDKDAAILDAVPEGSPKDEDTQGAVKVGIDGNQFRAHAVHKTHTEGMRADFLTTTLDLVVKTQVPVTGEVEKDWEQLRLDENLYVIGEEPYQFKDTHTLFQGRKTQGETEYASMETGELKACTQMVGVPLALCPRDLIRPRGTCEEALIKGNVVEDCLAKFERWDVAKPYIKQRGRSPVFVVFVPIQLTLLITCPNKRRKTWDSSTAKGLLRVVVPPFCSVHLGEQRHLAIYGMVQTQTISNMDGEVVETALKAFARDHEVEWEELQEVIHSSQGSHQTLQEAFTEVEGNNFGIPGRVGRFIGWICAIVAGTGGLALSLFLTVWGCRRYRQLWLVVKEWIEGQKHSTTPPTDTEGGAAVNILRHRVHNLETEQRQLESEVHGLRRLGATVTSGVLRNALNNNIIRERPGPVITENQPLMTTTVGPGLDALLEIPGPVGRRPLNRRRN